MTWLDMTMEKTYVDDEGDSDDEDEITTFLLWLLWIHVDVNEYI